ncbi:endonuclease domain-containing protein, partial [Bradyrhizobium sp. BRP22]|nr:endonuclease domain-containing protein [Bradyrhizobium sp. BRP22]
MRGRNEKMIRIARKLRANQTDAETVLWNRIRSRQIDGHKFVRQQPISGYVCDFVCRERLLIIEVDGGQHSESASDATRDRRLTEEDYKVLRFWNNDVLGNLEGVLSTIQAELRGGSPLYLLGHDLCDGSDLRFGRWPPAKARGDVARFPLRLQPWVS